MTYKIKPGELPPLCRYCGKAIAKTVDTIHVYAEPQRDHVMEPVRAFVRGRVEVVESRKLALHVPRHVIGTPKTKAELLPLLAQVSNQPMTVVSLKRHGDGIDEFNVWDGETYVDPYFHSGRCAQQFAYMMAAAYPTKGASAWVAAVAEQRTKAAKKVPA